MLKPDVPTDEAQRIVTLAGLNILDTPAEERFDRITRIAQHALGVPIALVSLIDTNRQWFKSCQGLDATETPRDISFCGHAILGDEAFVISDALLDPRFSDNPLVTGAPHIRFYAGQPLKAVNGSRLGTLCIIDLRPRQLNESDLKCLRDLGSMVEIELNSTERKKVERMKNEFISIVSHELRTPLTSIRGSLGLLAGGIGGALPAQVRTLVDIAYKNSERLILLVNDILDMEKIECGKMEFHLRPAALMPLLKQALEGNRAYADQFNVTLELECELPDVMAFIDANRLMQALTNLLSNAVKFSPSGGKVMIAATRSGRFVRVSVSDHGSGIPEQFHNQIFQKFAQADSSDTRRKGGTGLGLSITRSIIEKMGGSIGFESQPGVLTTFYIEFPIWQETASEKSDLRKRVLICESDRDAAALLRLALAQAGMEADVACDGAQSRQMLAQHDYAAMTVGLSGQQVMELVSELRSNESTAALPIVVLSDYAIEGRNGSNGEPFNVIDWVSKPDNRDRFVELLQQAVGKALDARPRVLHVEDDPDAFRVVSVIVGGLADLDNAATLADAVSMLKNHHYDLAILDLSLPDGSGLQLLPMLNGASPPIPVVIFSASDRALEDMLGIKSVLVKSRTDNARLLATIRRLIGAG